MTMRGNLLTSEGRALMGAAKANRRAPRDGQCVERPCESGMMSRCYAAVGLGLGARTEKVTGAL